MYSSYKTNLKANPATIDDVSQKKINQFKIVRLAKAGAQGSGYWFSGELKESWRNNGILVNDKVVPILDNNCISFSISQDFDSFWDKVTGNQLVQLVDKASAAARMLTDSADPRIHVSKYVKMPVLKAVGPIQMSSSLKFNFYFGQAGLYDGLEEVVKPIIAIAKTFMPGGGGWGNAPSSEWALSKAVRSLISTFAGKLNSSEAREKWNIEKRIQNSDPKFQNSKGEYLDPYSGEYATAYKAKWKEDYLKQNPDSEKDVEDAWNEALEKDAVPAVVKAHTQAADSSAQPGVPSDAQKGMTSTKQAAIQTAYENSDNSDGKKIGGSDMIESALRSSDGASMLEKVASTLSGLQNLIYDAIDTAGGVVAGYHKGCRIQIGRYVTPSFLVKDVSWDFDFTNIDQNGFPTKGSVTLGGLESIVAGGGGMIGDPPAAANNINDTSDEIQKDQNALDKISKKEDAESKKNRESSVKVNDD